MERKIRTLILFLMITATAGAEAQNKAEIYSAYISGDMEQWKNVIDRMEEVKSRDNSFLLELVNYQYGYIAWAIGVKQNSEARRYLKLAEANLAVLEGNRYKLSMVNAYKAAFYGYRIGLNVLQAPFIGPRSVESANLAMKLDPSNPYGYIQYGNSQYYMPAMFGGSKEEAIKHYLKAEELMASDEEFAENNWNYLNLLTVLAQAFSETGDLASAKEYYDKILKKEPGFIWVKDQLYKDLMKNMQN
jgi:tetratricopeptide (TPR) repeat protein